MVIIGKSVDEINTSLEVLSNYCNTWSLDVNAQKTKVMVFRRRVVYSTVKFLHIMVIGWK